MFVYNQQPQKNNFHHFHVLIDIDIDQILSFFFFFLKIFISLKEVFFFDIYNKIKKKTYDDRQQQQPN